MVYSRVVSSIWALCLTLVAGTALHADTAEPWRGTIRVETRTSYSTDTSSNAGRLKIVAHTTCVVKYTLGGYTASADLRYDASYAKTETAAGVTTTYTESLTGHSVGPVPINPVVQLVPNKPGEYGRRYLVSYNPYVVDMVANTVFQSTNNPTIKSVRHVSSTCHDISPLYIGGGFKLPLVNTGTAIEFIKDSKTAWGRGGMHNEEYGSVKSTWDLARQVPR